MLEEKLRALECALNVNDVVVIRRTLETLVSGYVPAETIVDWVYLAQSTDDANVV